MSDKSAVPAIRPLSGEELLSVFSRKEQLASENARLRDKQRRRRLSAYVLGKENGGGGKSVLELINSARLATAHFALTNTGRTSYTEAAATLISWRPAIRRVLKNNRGASFTDKMRIVQLRKNFQSGRATKNKDARLAYRYARKAINRCKGNPDALELLAVRLVLAINL